MGAKSWGKGEAWLGLCQHVFMVVLREKYCGGGFNVSMFHGMHQPSLLCRSSQGQE